VLILEDDFSFTTSKREFDYRVNQLNTRFPDWQVAMLSTVHSKTNGTSVPGISHVLKADTTAGYLIRQEAITAVFNVFLNCTKPPRGNFTNNYAIDVAWQAIQPKMNWFIFEPYIGTQSEEFPSDIEKFRQVQWMI
jgi:hypothetical protein